VLPLEVLPMVPLEVLPVLVALLPAADGLVALLPAADVEFVLLPCANTCSAITADSANDATMATIAIKFNLDIHIYERIKEYIILYMDIRKKIILKEITNIRKKKQ
jgi:hypothetical protein